MLEHSSPHEFQKLVDLEESMDPFWRSKPPGPPKIGDTDEETEYSEQSSFDLKVVGDSSKPEGKTFTWFRAESIDNGFATAYSIRNRMNLDSDEEERYRKTAKAQKLVLKYMDQLKEVLDEHETVFAADSSKPPPQVDRELCEHVIELKEGERLGFSPGMRRMSQFKDEFIEERLKKLVKAKMITKLAGTNSVSHACQVHVVTAPGREPRLTIDYRPVNEKTKADSFPLPRMDELLYGFAGSEVFSTIDALKGFWQIRMEGKSRDLTAFRTRSGVYVWNVMPMGLKNAPATFQRFMSQCFGHLDFVKVYIDDVIIHSKDAPTHLNHIRKVLQTCQEKGITLKASKCHFLKSKLKILGYYVSKDGISQDPEKLNSIKNFGAPQNLRELRRFLGMIQFFRMFSSATARILIPLYQLCRKGVRWRWKDEEKAAFQQIKDELLKVRTLAYPDVTKKFFVSVDASDFAFGANLYQFREAPDGTLEIDQVLAYSDEWTPEELAEFRKKQKVPFIIESFSKKWNKHEVNYSTSEKECLAIVNALERWSHYLAPKEFEVWSDHRALTSLARTEKPRLKRWKLRLTPFNFDLKWKAGRTMKDVDTLSRDARFKSMFVDVVKGFRVDTCFNTLPTDYDEDEFSALAFREIEFNFAADMPAYAFTPSDEDLLCLLGDRGKDGEAPAAEEGSVPLPGSVNQEEKQRMENIDDEVRRSLLGSHHDFGVSQRRDAALRHITEQIEAGEEPEPGYSLRDDGVLLREGKIVVPKHEIPLLLWLMHDHPFAGHVGANKLMARIRERFFVKKLGKVVSKYLKKCSCSRVKARRSHGAGRTITFSHYGPLDCLQVDLVGPFPTSRRGNKYWVTLIDRYTRALELVPVKSKDAKVVARAIADHWVTRYGCPLVLMADNEFRSGVLKELLALTDTKQIHSAPYRPSTNGLCERVHQFAHQLMQNAKMESVGEWDSHLPAIRFAIMSSRLDGLGFSPYQLLYGRNPRLPVDELIPYDTGVPADVTDYFNSQMEVLKEIRDLFDYRQSKVDARMRYKRDRSQNRKPTTLRVGDLVYHTRDYYGKSKLQRGLVKLLGKFAGPSPIVKALGENTFEVQVSDSKTKVFNVRDLALYGGEEMPIFRSRPDSDLDQVPSRSSGTSPDSSDMSSARLEEKSEILNLPESPRKIVVPEISEAKERESKSALRKRVRFADDPQFIDPKEKHKPSEDEGMIQPVPPEIGEETQSLSFEGQWVLAYDLNHHRDGKVSLMVGRISGIDVEGLCSIHVYRPRSIQKKVRYLPMYYKYAGSGDSDYETRITDQPLPNDWLPWVVDLDHAVKIVAKSHVREEGRSPPDRFQKFYSLVWDGKKKETDSPEKYLLDENAILELRPRRMKRVAAEENPSNLRRSKRRKSSHDRDQ